MFHDCLAALRSFRRRPLVTAAAVICLAIGIGGTTAVFSVFDWVLLRRLPYPGVDRLVLLRTVNSEQNGNQGQMSEAELRDLQAASQSFEGIAGYRFMTIDLVDAERSERLHGLWVTPEFFRVFDIQPTVGHLLSDDAPPAIILGHGVWQRRFGSDPRIVEQSIPIGICCPQQPQNIRWPVAGAIDHNIPFPPTVRGIRDLGHGLNDHIDYFAPLYVKNARRPEFRNTEAVAKLRPGVTIARAQTEMAAFARRMEESFPDTNRGWTIQVVPVANELFANVRPILVMLMAAAAFVLLIACANVAVILTFDAVRRFHEIAVRTALGANARQLLRQFLTESVALAVCGGAVGLLIAFATQRFLISLAPAGLPRINEISIDVRILGVGLLAIVLCGILIGLVPSLRVLRLDMESALRSENSRNATSHARAKTYEPLLVMQVALTLVLLIGSALMFKSLTRLFAVPTGFKAENLITATLSLPGAKHAWSYNSRFLERVVDRIGKVPGVVAAGAIRGLPMQEVRFEGRFWRWDRPAPDPSRVPLARLRVVSPGYFRAMGIPLREGRDFLPEDNIGEMGKTRGIVINERMAQLLWPGESAVGKQWATFSLWTGGTAGDTPGDVFGVVGDARYSSLDSVAMPEVYLPEGTFPQDEFSVVIRTASDPVAMAPSLRSAIQEIEKDVFIGGFELMSDIVTASESQRRFGLLLLSAFSGLGLLLAVMGIAGIVAYSFSLRIREVGIRIAMGASPRHVVLLLARQGLVPSFVGLGLGSVLALGLSRFLSHLLYAVSPYDPVVFGSAILGLGIVSVLTAAISASRACRLDPSAIIKAI